MIERSLGHINDHDDDVEEDLRDRHVGHLIGAGHGELPAIVDYSTLLEDIPDQGQTSSCVGQAFATSIYVRARIEGHAIPRPSAKAIYDVARLIDSPKKELVDDGSRPRAAVMGMQEYGLVSTDRWPLTEQNVNDVPPLDVFRAGFGALLSAYYRIDGDFAQLARVALAKRFIPVFAMEVDTAYMNVDDGTIYGGLTGKVKGSHMQAIVGYGPGYLLIATSWGRSHGRHGFVRIADAFFNTKAVSDGLVPTIIPAQVA